MDHASAADRQEIWDLIKHEHVAVLVIVAKDVRSTRGQWDACRTGSTALTVERRTFRGNSFILKRRRSAGGNAATARS